MELVYLMNFTTLRYFLIFIHYFRMSLSISVMSIIGWCLYHMAERHNFMKIFYYMCYLYVYILFYHNKTHEI